MSPLWSWRSEGWTGLLVPAVSRLHCGRCSIGWMTHLIELAGVEVGGIGMVLH